MGVDGVGIAPVLAGVGCSCRELGCTSVCTFQAPFTSTRVYTLGSVSCNVLPSAKLVFQLSMVLACAVVAPCMVIVPHFRSVSLMEVTPELSMSLTDWAISL